MTVAYSDSLMYNSRVDRFATEKADSDRPATPIHRMNTTEVFMIKKVCPICGKEFNVETKHRNQICCSKKCANLRKLIDLTGQKFGRLTAICKVESNKHGQVQWLCECECGKKIIARGYQLKNGNTRSCGCLQKETLSKMSRKHGGAHNRLYVVWVNMKLRCNDVKNISYKNYGARGIKVCEEWLDFSNFQEWALSNGYDFNAKRNECTLDRIDNNGNYEPNNCRWITIKEQTHNTRKNHNITINGETHCVAEWARIYNIKRETLKDRIARGWDEVKAVTTPAKEKV